MSSNTLYGFIYYWTNLKGRNRDGVAFSNVFC